MTKEQTIDTRGEKCSGKDFVRSLKRYGKPIVMVSTNPYEELLIPDDIGTVLVSYGLMRESSILKCRQALAAYEKSQCLNLKVQC